MSRVHLLAPILFGILAQSTSYSAGVIRHDRDAKKYDELGKRESFQSTCIYLSNFRRPQDKGCAVLISSRWALTAAHVVSRKGDKSTKDHRLIVAGESYRIAEAKLHPKYLSDSGVPNRQATENGHDIALVRLARPVLKCQPAIRYRGNDEKGERVTIIGHGVIGTGKAGLQKPLKGLRRGGNNIVDSAGGVFGNITVSDRVLLYDFDDPASPTLNTLGSSNAIDLEVCSSPGDSGGGWYLHAEDQWKLVAINSGLVPLAKCNGDSKYGTVGAGMRVSAVNDWIDEIISTVSARLVLESFGFSRYVGRFSRRGYAGSETDSGENDF